LNDTQEKANKLVAYHAFKGQIGIDIKGTGTGKLLEVAILNLSFR
jgi:hypothetical protein